MYYEVEVSLVINPGGGGGGTHPGLGYPLQNRLPELWLYARKRVAVTDPRTLRKGAVRGAFSVGAVIVSLASPRKASWISYN